MDAGHGGGRRENHVQRRSLQCHEDWERSFTTFRGCGKDWRCQGSFRDEGCPLSLMPRFWGGIFLALEGIPAAFCTLGSPPLEHPSVLEHGLGALHSLSRALKHLQPFPRGAPASLQPNLEHLGEFEAIFSCQGEGREGETNSRRLEWHPRHNGNFS